MIELLLDTGAIGWNVQRAQGGVWQRADACGPGVVRIGVHDGGLLPAHRCEAFDILLTQAPDAPRPWVPVADTNAEIAHLEARFLQQPLAATVLAQVLRMTQALDFGAAILVESFAYSTLLASDGFRTWRLAARPQRARADSGPRVRLERVGETLHIVLDRPHGRNAIDAMMRDALIEALEAARLDPGSGHVLLRGEGAVFSIGGDLAEFGQARDQAAAHAIRTLRSAVQGVHAIRDRVTAQVHGPCIGAAVEIAAAAGCVTARQGTSFRLPEVAMGLIPGAGGTVTVPRRIGRHRACWMALGGCAVDTDRALSWGLVDAMET